MLMPTIKHKRGDTFEVVCTYKDTTGTPTNLTSIDIKSQIRNVKGELLSELTVTKLDQTLNPGKFTLGASASTTQLWTTETFYWDIQYTSSGVVTSTETMTIEVVQDQTRQ